jgi:hypothetical protein
VSNVSTDEVEEPFDRFELATAILLGLTAVGAALAGLQSNQWGGKQLEGFSAANTLTTKAATQYTEDTVLINADYAAVASAKSYILLARDSQNDAERERNLDLASYYYTSQLSLGGYEAMNLPNDFFAGEEEEEEGAEGEDEAEGTEEEDAETAAHSAMIRELPDEVLFASLQTDLDDDYIDKALKEGNEMFEEADQKFEEGKVANDNGDKFELAVVLFTVALFFAGLGLVFKTKLRWSFLAAGTFVFSLTTIYILTLPWA